MNGWQKKYLVKHPTLNYSGRYFSSGSMCSKGAEQLSLPSGRKCCVAFSLRQKRCIHWLAGLDCTLWVCCLSLQVQWEWLCREASFICRHECWEKKAAGTMLVSGSCSSTGTSRAGFLSWDGDQLPQWVSLWRQLLIIIFYSSSWMPAQWGMEVLGFLSPLQKRRSTYAISLHFISLNLHSCPLRTAKSLALGPASFGSF